MGGSTVLPNFSDLQCISPVIVLSTSTVYLSAYVFLLSLYLESSRMLNIVGERERSN